MPLFVAAVVAAHRRGRTSTITVPVNAPPLWVMVMDETFITVRALASRLRRWWGESLSTPRWETGSGSHLERGRT